MSTSRGGARFSTYQIKQYSYDQATKIGVQIKPSLHPGKKIDVYSKEGKFLAAIGDTNYKDYPTYLEDEGKVFAEARRRLFRIRHAKSLSLRGTPGWYAGKLLW